MVVQSSRDISAVLLWHMSLLLEYSKMVPHGFNIVDNIKRKYFPYSKHCTVLFVVMWSKNALFPTQDVVNPTIMSIQIATYIA